MNFKRVLISPIMAFGLLFIVSMSCKKDKWPRCERANGKIGTETRTLNDFSKIVLEGSGDVYLYQIDSKTTPSVEITSSKNVMNRVVTKLEGDKLILTNKCILGKNKLSYKVYVSDLSSVVISGSGNITTSTKFTLDKIDMNISGSGNIVVELDASDVTTEIHGSGNITLNGTTSVLDASINGSGNIKAFSCPTTDCFVDISGSGNCEVYVNGRFNVNISGSGDVVYDGDPNDFEYSVSGSGSVKKR